jgi:Flp pilus assembly protein TadG
MIRCPGTTLLACRRGTTAIEVAFLAPIFFGLLFGIVNFSLLMWTQVGLHFAAGTAARCASVDSTICSSPDAVVTYAMSKYLGRPLGDTNPFSYSTSDCGHRVNASYTYALSIPLYGSYSVPLSATACFP